MIKEKKKAEAYIDTVVTVFLCMIVVYLVMNLFLFLVQYQKIDDVAENMVEYCAVEGKIDIDEITAKYQNYAETAGIDIDKFKFEFSGTEFSSDHGENRVQYGDKIVLSVSYEQELALMNSDKLTFPLSVSKLRTSQKYWKAAVKKNNLSHGGTVPPGGTYYVGATFENGANSKWNTQYVVKITEGEAIPPEPHTGDFYVYNGIIYGYNTEYDLFRPAVSLVLDGKETASSSGGFVASESLGGWGLRFIEEKSEYTVLESISGKPVVSAKGAFANCTSLVVPPELPQSIEGDLSAAFFGCTSLASAPNISTGVTSMYLSFYGCSNLTSPPVIPAGITNLNSAFSNCAALETMPKIPYGVTTMDNAFANCVKIKTASSIPSTVNSMASCFSGCSSLVTAPKIPSSVVSMSTCFSDCASLTGNIEIDANPTSYTYCFNNTVKPILITGFSTQKEQLAATASSNNVKTE